MNKKNPEKESSRRKFLKNSLKGAVGTLALTNFPTIVPAHVVSGPLAPSNRINVGCIGNGRISRDHDMPGVWKHDAARIIAVCDLDKNRLQSAQKLVTDYYTKKTGQASDAVKMYDDYRELLNNKEDRKSVV